MPKLEPKSSDVGVRNEDLRASSEMRFPDGNARPRPPRRAEDTNHIRAPRRTIAIIFDANRSATRSRNSSSSSSSTDRSSAGTRRLVFQ